MPFMLIGALALVSLLLVFRRRAPRSIDAAQLGSVSARWLAEYRASHLS
jgi:hypothetical protein